MSVALRGWNRPIGRVLLIALTVWAWVGLASYGAPEGTPLSGLAAEEVWRDGVALIHQGRFEDATAKIATLSRSDAAVERLSGWLDDMNEQTQMRAEMTLADYEKYVQWAQRRHRKDELSKALDYTVRALNSAVSREAFRQEGWVGDLIDDAMAKAAELRLEKEWLEALSLYYQIGEILERDANVRRLIRECRTHARLDAIYNKENKWEERLVGIEQRMVVDALREIDRKYVEEVDFRALTEAALEQMLLLTESAALRELFESVQDDLERGAFEARIRANLAKVRNASRVDFKVARDQFLNALRINRQTIQLPEELVVNEYMGGCLEELDDFTAVMWPAQMPEFNKHTRGDFVGVGIQIRAHYNPELKDDEIVVVTPIEDSPAYDAGIQTGDIITKVDGKPIMGISLTKAVETITGPIGTSVTLTVRRESEPGELAFILKRDNIKIHSVKGFARDPVDDQKWQYMIDPEYGIGYIRVVSFQENSVEDLRKTIDHLARNKLRGLILDLRFNPGGLLRTAVQFSELFLDENETIVSTRGLNSPTWPIPARRRGPYCEVPLVVLVNEQSASASEIVAGAVKDHDRGLIVGERTYGKFSVQNLIQLARSDAYLKLTTARYYLPSGKSLHRDEDSTEWGVETDILIPLVSKEVTKIWQGFRKRDIIGSRADTLAQKVLSDEEADLRAEADRAKKAADRSADSDEPKTAPEAGEADAADGPTEEPAADDGDTGEPDEEQEEEIDRNDRPDIDPQLDAALLVMRAYLLDLSHHVVAEANEVSDDVRSE